MPFTAIWIQLEIIILSELSQNEKDKYHYDITYMWNLKYGTNEQNRLTDIKDRPVVTKKVRWEGEGETGSLRLVDANSYIQSGQTTRSYCIAHG